MPRSIRVRLDPDPTPGARGDAPIRACRVSLEHRGHGMSLGTIDAPQPARLSFFLRRIDGIRENTMRGPDLLAFVDGRIVLRGSAPRPTFIVTSADPVLQQVSPDPESKFAVLLELDPESFEGLESITGPLEITLPADVNESRSLQIDSSLEIGGADEAALGLNDPLDVPLPLPATARFEVEIVNDLDQPLEGVDLTFSINGETLTATTDGDGVAFVEGTASGLFTVRAGVGLNDALASRDPETPRTDPFPSPDEAMTVTPSKLKQGVPVPKERQRILVVAYASLVHGVRSTGWEGLALGEPAPVVLDQDHLTRVGVAVRDGDEIVFLQKPTVDGANGDVWIQKTSEELGGALCRGDFDAVWSVLADIPLSLAASDSDFSPEGSDALLDEPESPGPDDPEGSFGLT